MDSYNVQVTDRLAWEGAIGVEGAMAIGAVLAVVACWSLWRERKALGGALAVLFFVLRAAAFGCALWMLAGPTQLRIERVTRPQSIAILADASQSMDVVDALDSTSARRWALAARRTEGAANVEQCDRLSVAIAAAAANCERFARSIAEHRGVDDLSEQLDAIAASLARAAEHAEALASSLDGTPSAERASHIASLLDGAAGDAVDDLRATLRSPSNHSADEQLAVSAEALGEALAGARLRAVALGDDLVELAAPSLDNGSGAETLSRRETIALTLDRFEAALDEDLAGNALVRRFRFDRAAQPITVDGGWELALERRTAGADGTARVPESASLAPDDEAGADEAATNVSAALQQLAAAGSSDPVRLAILLSDGRHNDILAASPADAAIELGDVPVYVVPIGNTAPRRDLLLHRVEAPATVTEHDSAVIDVIVTAFECDGETSAVVLRHQGREIDRKPVAFDGSRGDYRMRFTVPADEVGWQEYIVEVEALDDEADEANNFVPISFEVVQDKIRVLLADGLARWEYRYLNQLFRREPHVEFDELLFLPQVHGTGALAERPALPQDVEAWARYDVVLLGDVAERQLSRQSQQSLDDYVRNRGGNLIVIAGRDSMPDAFQDQPLMDLLPIELSTNVSRAQGYTLALTDEGRLHSALLIADAELDSRREWQQMFDRFPIYSLSDFCRAKPTARTLIEAVSEAAGDVVSDQDAREIGRAFLCWHRVGAGRVAYLAAPETFRLRFRRGDELHHRFWGQFLRWITASNVGAGAELVRLQTDRTRYAPGENVEVTVWLKDETGRPVANESIEVEARTFAGASMSAQLSHDRDVAGRYFGVLKGLSVGAHQISARGRAIDVLLPPSSDAPQAQSTITVGSSGGVEMANTQCDLALLEQIARSTGGQIIPPTALGEVLQSATFGPLVSERVDRVPLWNRWTYLLIVFACLISEWTIRKATGLV